MKSSENDLYLLSIAQKIIKESTPNQIYQKYQQIKSSVCSLKSSTLKQKQDIDKGRIYSKSTPKQLKSQRQSLKQISTKVKCPDKIYSLVATKIRSNNDSELSNLSSTKKKSRSKTFINQNIEPIFEKSKLNKGMAIKSILKNKQNSSFLRNDNQKQEKFQNEYQMKNENPVFSDKIIQKRLFGQSTNQKLNHNTLKSQSNNIYVSQKQTSFNQQLQHIFLNLKRLVYQYAQEQKRSPQKVKISTENVDLFEAIHYKLDKIKYKTEKSSFFTSKKLTNRQSLANITDQIEQFKMINLDPSKQSSVSHSNNKIYRQNNLVHQQSKNKMKTFEESQKLSVLKSDNKWLIESVQSLLKQNSQLKRLITSERERYE